MESGGPYTDAELIVAMKDAKAALQRLTQALVSEGGDELAIIPRLQLPLHPEDIDDYSEDLAEMRTQSDPYPTETPSKPEYLTGELERIRYQLAAILGKSYWYEDPITDLTALNTLTIEHTAAILANAEDVLAHGSRHAASGADALPNNAITSDMIKDGEIVNADVNNAAAIAWGKIAVDGNVVYDNVAETITAKWTWTGAQVDFNDGTNLCGTIRGLTDYMILENQVGDNMLTFPRARGDSTRLNSYASDDIEINADGSLLLRADGLIRATSPSYAYLYLEIECTTDPSGGIYPNQNNAGYCGAPTLAWAEVNSCIINDLVCSEAPIPDNAFEVLATLKHTLIQNAPQGKFRSENFPSILRPVDRKTHQPIQAGRNISRTLDFVLFAMGDIHEVLSRLDERLSTLEEGG